MKNIAVAENQNNTSAQRALTSQLVNELLTEQARTALSDALGRNAHPYAVGYVSVGSGFNEKNHAVLCTLTPSQARGMVEGQHVTDAIELGGPLRRVGDTFFKTGEPRAEGMSGQLADFSEQRRVLVCVRNTLVLVTATE